ncbi:MAG: ABC transporter ATP-binding protein [Clostridia bacterium]|nr:ABC transporter ATP-binding protein [Clostridia bacterium]
MENKNTVDKAAQLINITKTFGPVVANDQVCLDIHRGEILALLGENGSGKTTLMNMLSGIYLPDEGHIIVNGNPVVIRSPRDAYLLGIGMVHQHFKLVDVLTAAENIVLGLNENPLIDLKNVRSQVKQICERYGFQIDPDKKVFDMSVSEKQTLEIIKILYRGAEILILDEPTAVLTPQETQKLFAVMRNMKADGKSIVIITHKLHEVMEISDRVAVLRRGKYVGEVATKDTNPQKLTDMMVGRAVSLNIARPEPKDQVERLVVKNLTVLDADGVKRLDNVSFTAYGGEILGIAGITGSGQRELLEAIAGLQRVESGGSIRLVTPDGKQEELAGKDPLDIYKLGVGLAFVPEDRFGMGLVGSMDLVDNVMLRSYKEGKPFFADRKSPKKLAERIVEQLQVDTPGLRIPIRRLSGGNVQKVLVGREIAGKPSLLMTAYAVRGLDIRTTHTIFDLLNEQKELGTAVIYVGEDLDVLLQLCDRILVLCAGKVSCIVDARAAKKEEIGLLMTHLGEEATACTCNPN